MTWKMGLAYAGSEDTARLGDHLYANKDDAVRAADEEAAHWSRRGYAVQRGTDGHWVVWKRDDESSQPFKIIVRKAVLV